MMILKRTLPWKPRLRKASRGASLRFAVVGNRILICWGLGGKKRTQINADYAGFQKKVKIRGIRCFRHGFTLINTVFEEINEISWWLGG
jgi:hypothetical protein